MSRNIPAYTNLQEESHMPSQSWETGGVKQQASLYSLYKNPKRKERKHPDGKGTRHQRRANDPKQGSY